MRDVCVVMKDGQRKAGMLLDYDPAGGTFSMQVGGGPVEWIRFADVKSAIVSVPYVDNLMNNWDLLNQAFFDGWDGT